MSGGHFDYQQYRIQDMVDSIEDYVYGRDLDNWEVEYIDDSCYTEDEIQYAKEYHHTLPNRYGYSEETITKFKEGIRKLKEAYVFAQRIDWLLSGDDGEETFHERLKEDLEECLR